MERNCGRGCWTDQGVALETIALSPNNTLWGYDNQNQVLHRASDGSWIAWSVVECINETPRKVFGDQQWLSVALDANGADQVWIYTGGRIFFRSEGALDAGCWTRAPNIPDQTQMSVSLGVYGLFGQTFPWISSTGKLFILFNGEWTLDDEDTGIVGGNNSYVSARFGGTLWSRDFLTGWRLDTTWPESRGLRAITQGSEDGSLAVIDGQNKVWHRVVF